MTKFNCCKDETLGTAFLDGVKFSLDESSLARKAGALTIVMIVSLCMVPIMGCAWLAEKLDGDK